MNYRLNIRLIANEKFHAIALLLEYLWSFMELCFILN